MIEKALKNVIILLSLVYLIVLNVNMNYTSPMHIIQAIDISKSYKESENYVGNFISIIEAVAEFYINNVPTYKTTMKTTENYFYETRPARDNIKPYLKELDITRDVPSSKRSSSEYYVEPDEDETDNKIIVQYGDGVNKFGDALGFLRKIVDRFYKVENIVVVNKNNADNETRKMYQYNGLYWYKWREYFTRHMRENVTAHMSLNGFELGCNVGLKAITEHARDDCSGFVKLVLDIFLNNKYIGAGTIPRDFVVKTLLGIENNTSRELMQGGFTVYKNDVGINAWRRYRYGNEEGTYSMTINDLKPGDILACDNVSNVDKYKIYTEKDENNRTIYKYKIEKKSEPHHAEFYIGYKYSTIYNDMSFGASDSSAVDNDFDPYEVTNVRKKSGIKSITRLEELHKTGNKAEGTFSWGNVADEFPLESSTGQMHYFYKDDDEAYFRHCECGEPEPGKMVALCRDNSREDKKITACTQSQIDSNSNLEVLTGFFPSHDLSSKNCYFSFRKYKIIWRQE